VAIVDVYDALTHDRVYRPAMPEEEAVEILENGRGTQFDPDLLRLFISLLPEIRRIAQEAPDEVSRSESRSPQPPGIVLGANALEAMPLGA
jgi:putative two-component system response regulator